MNSRQPAPLFLALTSLAFIAISAWWLDTPWEQAFRSDNSPVAWLSSAQLLAGAFLALRLTLDGSLSLRFGAWLVAALAGLSIDEQFMLHEHWKYGCKEWLVACGNMPWLAEAPMRAVALLGSLTLWQLYRQSGEGPPRYALWLALVAGLAAVGIDQLGAPAGIAVFEEGLEVLSESFLLGFLLGMEPPPSAAQTSGLGSSHCASALNSPEREYSPPET